MQYLNIGNKELSAISGVPLRTLNNILSGVTSNPSIENVISIAHALSVSTDRLIQDNATNNTIPEPLQLVHQQESSRVFSVTPIPVIDKITEKKSILIEDNIIDIFYAGSNINADCCVKCKDDLIGAFIKRNDLVFIRQTSVYVDDRLYALITNSDNVPRVRRIYVESDFLILDACDPHKRPIIADKSEVLIIGECVGIYRAF